MTATLDESRSNDLVDTTTIIVQRHADAAPMTSRLSSDRLNPTRRTWRCSLHPAR